MTYFRNGQTGEEPPKPASGRRRAGARTTAAVRDWMYGDEKTAQRTYLSKLYLGVLPRRAAKCARIDFDLEDERDYGGEDGTQAPGQMLAGLAAHIVSCAKDAAAYLAVLAHIPANIIGPIKTYLRVKLALGKLEAEIEKTTQLSSRNCEAISGTSPVQEGVEEYRADKCATAKTPESKRTYPETPETLTRSRIFSSENSGMTEVGEVEKSVPRTKSYVWDTSPAKAYDFKSHTEAHGYDPRDTSVYWIEKRAARLRRKWTAYRKYQSGEPPKPSPARKKTDKTAEPKTRVFVPADADYDTVWPPIKLPDGPPKISAQAETSPPKRIRPAAVPPLPRSRIFSSENSGMTAVSGFADDVCELAEGVDASVASDVNLLEDHNAPLSSPTLSSRSSAARAGTSPEQDDVDVCGNTTSPAPKTSEPKRTRPATPKTLTRSRIFSGEDSGMTGVRDISAEVKIAENREMTPQNRETNTPAKFGDVDEF